MKESETNPRPLQLLVGRQEINCLVTVLYGHVDINSWIEWDGEKFIGMGSKTVYDRDGNITEHSVTPTGSSIKIAGPMPRGFGGWFTRWFRSPNAKSSAESAE